ncbi:MAG: tRNA pseudouridine38-40 synthase [Paraglaciecola sp.]|jgi:tRNA pseudouridine38-40 synthase
MRVALGIEYDGASYYGWQRQKDVIGVQQHVEEAVSRIANESINVVCAGRTDSGVHACGQVVHFDTTQTRPERAWTLGVNTYLPDAVSIKWVKTVADDFHARFSATARRYRYIIYNKTLRSAILANGVTHIHAPLDHTLMHEAAQCLIGKHDFSAFRAVDCQAKTAIRTLSHIRISRTGDYIVIDVQANAFLYHMVRNITGSLVAIGSGAKPVQWMAELLLGQERTQAAAMVKPNGLYMVDVTYPARFDLPTQTKQNLGPVFLSENF